MYEQARHGLGWETVYETNWYGGRTETPKGCHELLHRGVPAAEAQERCFKDTTAERSLAMESQCERIGWECETRGEAGASWCCPPGYPDRQVPEGYVTPGEPEVIHVSPDHDEPAPVPQHTFWGRMTHPGAMAVFALVGVIGYLGYRQYMAAESRRFAYV